jgi:multidrug efflux pump subunit AcrA (membrane-fusion protein)
VFTHRLFIVPVLSPSALPLFVPLSMSRTFFTAKLAACLAVSFSISSCTRQLPVQAKQEPGPIAVKTAPVTSREVRRIVQSVGTLFPFDETVISAEIEGRVAEVNADLGDRVTKGQVLVRISDEEQRYILAQTEAQLRMAMERVGLRNENDRIKDIRDASEVRRAQADLFDAEQHYKRIQSLVNQGIGSKAELSTTQPSIRRGTSSRISSGIRQRSSCNERSFATPPSMRPSRRP